jgi:excisionase family DNA binding protein
MQEKGESMSEIKEYEVYTLKESQDLLKVSERTMMRMIKKGTLLAGKVGGQYRILGKELLRLLLPKETYGKAAQTYRDVRDWAKLGDGD